MLRLLQVNQQKRTPVMYLKATETREKFMQRIVLFCHLLKTFLSKKTIYMFIVSVRTVCPDLSRC